MISGVIPEGNALAGVIGIRCEYVDGRDKSCKVFLKDRA